MSNHPELKAYAAIAMQGIMANPVYFNHTPHRIAEDAVRVATALLKALEPEGGTAETSAVPSKRLRPELYFPANWTVNSNVYMTGDRIEVVGRLISLSEAENYVGVAIASNVNVRVEVRASVFCEIGLPLVNSLHKEIRLDVVVTDIYTLSLRSIIDHRS